MSIDDVLAELRKSYLAGLPVKIESVGKLMSERRFVEIETEFHKLKGTGKTYGLPEVSQLGELAERLCEVSESSAESAVPTALKILRKIHDARTKGQPLNLTEDVDFLYLSELARQAHDAANKS